MVSFVTRLEEQFIRSQTYLSSSSSSCQTSVLTPLIEIKENNSAEFSAAPAAPRPAPGNPSHCRCAVSPDPAMCGSGIVRFEQMMFVDDVCSLASCRGECRNCGYKKHPNH